MTRPNRPKTLKDVHAFQVELIPASMGGHWRLAALI